VPALPEIKHAVVGTAHPTGKGDLGSAEEVHYFCEGDLLTMCSADGTPLRDADGRLITHRLAPGENAAGIARNITLRRWRASQGDETAAAFDRPIRYGRSTVV
jgi:hypothetical protein